jgi:multiple antibiotic resistance protein
MNDGSIPWGTLFGLLFMAMGPIRAVAVFGTIGGEDAHPDVRALAARAIGLAAIAFTVALLLGDQSLARWGVQLPALIMAAGIIIVVVSLHSMLSPADSPSQVLPAAKARAADVAFPNLLPPLAVALPVIFAAAVPGAANKAVIFFFGMLIFAIDWLAMRHAKWILAKIGPGTLQLLGAVFGVLQTALGIEFILDAYRMLPVGSG